MSRHTWLSLLPQQGLVVSPWVLDELGLFSRQPPELHAALRAHGDRLRSLDDLVAWLGWPAERLVREDGDHLLRAADHSPLLRVRWDDRPPDARVDHTTPQEQFEQDLLQRGQPHGALVGPDHVRLVVAPRGEASGWLDFPLDALLAHEHRVLVDGLYSLLGAPSLLSAAPGRRTADLLRQTRERQEGVTQRLADQVESALRTLLGAFEESPVPSPLLYEGLVTVLLRLVFLLYAEHRELLPVDQPLYQKGYAVSDLADRLAREAVLHGPALQDRYGAWARLLATFRLVWSGIDAGDLQLPARDGDLFDPLRFPFLEGRPLSSRSVDDRAPLPRVSDQVVHEVLDALVWLDGLRLSYRNLEVEQIGSVYESLMGYTVVRAAGPGLWIDRRAVWLDALRDAPDALVALAAMLEERPARLRADLPQLATFRPTADRDADLRALQAALSPRVRQPPIAPGRAVLVAGSARRSSGSHYTPRALSEPVVDRTLAPALQALTARRYAAEKDRHRVRMVHARRRARDLLARATGQPVTTDEVQPDALPPAWAAHLRAAGFTFPPVPLRASCPDPIPTDLLDLRVVDPAMGSGAFLAAACRWLATRLVDAWARTGTTPDDPRPDLLARRLVAERCLYGVDKNPMAVTLARVSLWLETSAAGLPFTFLDHNLRPGDSVVGLDVPRLEAMDLTPSTAPDLFTAPLAAGLRRLRLSPQPSLFGEDEVIEEEEDEVDDAGLPRDLPTALPAGPTPTSVREAMADSLARAARERDVLARQPRLGFAGRRTWLREADEQTWDEGRIGDAILGAVWLGGSDKALRERLRRLRQALLGWYPASYGKELPEEAREALEALEEAGLRPLHWPLVFPEVFTREPRGFDAVIGNPPFGGQETIRQANGGPGYIKLLQELWTDAHGNSDLVAYFFRRAASILRPEGHLGLIATNTVAQGKTRETGLGWLVDKKQIELVGAEVDRPWPGQAAVVVSVVHAVRGTWSGARWLDVGEGPLEVEALSSALKGEEETEAPVKLRANHGRSFEGTKVYGQGFVLTPEQADELIGRDGRNAEIVKPYIGGEELNNNLPDEQGFVRFNRWVIDFGDRALEECERWPELLEIVRRLVKPEREQLNDNPDGRRRKQFWWHFGRRTSALNAAVATLSTCLANSQVSKHHLVGIQPTNRVFAHSLNVFPFDSTAYLSLLQSRVHEAWARHAGLGSTMKTDARYTPSTCFETFPFPQLTPAHAEALAVAGAALDRRRTEAMRALQVGMTGVWNALLDPLHRAFDAQEVVALRGAREEMDAAVLAAYGWGDLDPADPKPIVRRLRVLNRERAALEEG